MDSAPLIYFLERVAPFFEGVAPVFEAIQRRRLVGLTSILSILEVTVQPLRLSRQDVAEQYEAILARLMVIRAPDLPVVRRAADMRARYRLAALDALQLATAIESGARAFVTNDRALARVTELPVVLVG